MCQINRGCYLAGYRGMGILGSAFPAAGSRIFVDLLFSVRKTIVEVAGVTMLKDDCQKK
jgi:hypothetical protein